MAQEAEVRTGVEYKRAGIADDRGEGFGRELDLPELQPAHLVLRILLLSGKLVLVLEEGVGRSKFRIEGEGRTTTCVVRIVDGVTRKDGFDGETVRCAV